MNQDFHLRFSNNVIFARYDEKWYLNPQERQLGDAINTLCQKHFSDRKWALFDDVRNWPVKSPQQIEYCSIAVDKLAESGMTHCAVCTGELAISEWMMRKVIPENIELAFFTYIDECENWLKNQGFDVDFSRNDSVETDNQ